MNRVNVDQIIGAVSVAYLRECVEIKGGRLVWLDRPLSHFSSDRYRRAFCSRFAGKRAGGWNGRYSLIRLQANGRQFHLYEHRIVWALQHGAWPMFHIDHINGDPLDNRIENLRDVEQTINLRNARRRSTNKSGVCGVYELRGKWAAQINVNGQSKWLGFFPRFEDAVSARSAAEKQLGFTVRHGTA